MNATQYAAKKQPMMNSGYYTTYQNREGKNIHELPLSIVLFDEPEAVTKQNGEPVVSANGSRLMKVGFIAVDTGKDGEKIYLHSDITEWVDGSQNQQEPVQNTDDDYDFDADEF